MLTAGAAAAPLPASSLLTGRRVLGGPWDVWLATAEAAADVPVAPSATDGTPPSLGRLLAARRLRPTEAPTLPLWLPALPRTLYARVAGSRLQVSASTHRLLCVAPRRACLQLTLLPPDPGQGAAGMPHADTPPLSSAEAAAAAAALGSSSAAQALYAAVAAAGLPLHAPAAAVSAGGPAALTAVFEGVLRSRRWRWLPLRASLVVPGNGGPGEVAAAFVLRRGGGGSAEGLVAPRSWRVAGARGPDGASTLLLLAGPEGSGCWGAVVWSASAGAATASVLDLRPVADSLVGAGWPQPPVIVDWMPTSPMEE